MNLKSFAYFVTLYSYLTYISPAEFFQEEIFAYCSQKKKGNVNINAEFCNLSEGNKKKEKE
jgi:hypothetical protein